ncbi:DNA primase [Silvimonas terrae]|uniref:DNA primase n=1 Tax=Silvimonas terrae TaxID=300266 RepID=A0A840RE68_9NEIS|nr:DNA primase [Silvimonas terrae]MBB5190818.1 DNA primase [Silvimonas terrae]
MARIPDSFIQDLLNRVDVVDVVERYLPLKKAGQNYSACCPFHKEKSPSFTVSPTKQFYHCFGCGAHGSAVNFVMEYEGLSFPEAIRKLAESVGLQVPEEAAPNEPKAEPGIYDVLKAAGDYYRQQLKSAPQAIAYLKGRGLDGKTAAHFGLGYAPAGQALKQVFEDYDWNKLLAEAGLVGDDEESHRRYDRFRDRVMFPILNQRGSVIGFGGRVMGDAKPKYLNSPETPVFEKGRELYGLTQARAAIRANGRVMVVEGYMDVVMLAQHGVEYAVATLGTACTPHHVQKLLKLADEVVFCFDGDKAGRKAAWRALENSLEYLVDGKRLAFLFLPEEHDPDSYVQEFGRERFEEVVSQDAVPLAQFLLRELSAQVELDTEEGRAKLVHLAKPLLAKVHAPAYALMVKKRLAQLCQLELSELEPILSTGQGGSGNTAQDHHSYAPPPGYAPMPQEEGWQPVQDYEQDGGAMQQGQRRFQRRSEGGWKGKRKSGGKWRNDEDERPFLPPRVQPDMVQGLLQLVLYEPVLATGVEPVWLTWPDNGDDLLLDVLKSARQHGARMNSSQLLELWRESEYYTRLAALAARGAEKFDRWPPEERQSEFANSLVAAGQSLVRAATLNRKAELEHRQAHGGLSDAERQEYMTLLIQSRSSAN